MVLTAIMPHRIEITLKPDLLDAEGAGIQKKAAQYFGIDLRLDAFQGGIKERNRAQLGPDPLNAGFRHDQARMFLRLNI